MRVLVYAWEEALASLRRSGRSAALAMGAIAAALAVLGGFRLAAANLQQIVDGWAATAELSVYVADEAGPADRERLAGILTGHPAVAGFAYVSKEGALDRFQRDFPELADVAAALEANPFPASFEVRLRAGTAEEAEALATVLEQDEAVADVRYDRRWLARLAAVMAAVRAAGLAVAAVLVLGAALTVMAIVRLSLEARREELEIMRLVGAPFAYLRGPFVAEGALQGAAGALAALALLGAVHATLAPQAGELLRAAGAGGAIRFFGPGDAALLVGVGAGVGAIAGALASRAARG